MTKKKFPLAKCKNQNPAAPAMPHEGCRARRQAGRRPGFPQIVIYRTEDGQTKLEVRLEDETLWLTQAALAELFQTTVANINIHLKSIYKEEELRQKATIKENLIVRKEGTRTVNRKVLFYNLPAIIAVGYRVNSTRGTQFRIWATERLNEYLVKGFTMDDERLKQGTNIGSDYFDELLERIRDIRASEKRFYQKIRDIYKLAVDYDPKAGETLEFFSIVQNKLHFAISPRKWRINWHLNSMINSMPIA